MSDLHLAPGVGSGSVSHQPPGGSTRGSPPSEAFTRWLAAERALGGVPPTQLVLLGDLFELGGPRTGDEDVAAAGTPPACLAELERIAVSHADLLGGLRDTLAAGWSVAIVSGNHDSGLAFPAVRTRLTELLSAVDGGLTFHPWIFHVPGIVYAEHGSQYHDINALMRPLEPLASGAVERLEQPLAERIAAELSRWRTSPAGARRWASAGPRLSAMVRVAALRGGRAARTVRGTYRRDVLPRYAAEIGLPTDVLAAVDALSDASFGSIARRLGGKLLHSRTLHPTQAWRHLAANNAGYLHLAARRIAAILRTSGYPVPYLVFGHTHLAEAVPLPGGSVYLNAGAWATSAIDRRYTFAVIEGDDSRLGGLWTWDDSSRDIRPAAATHEPASGDPVSDS